MNLHVLGSGSKGNCAIVESDDSAIMIDCGLSRKAARERMQELGFDESKIAAIFVTHEHNDHVSGLGVNLRGLKMEGEMPVYTTAGTRNGCKYLRDYENTVRITAGSTLSVGGIDVEVFGTSHDAAEPVGFRFSKAAGDSPAISTIGYMTDTGVCTPMAAEMLAGCEVLAIEGNHDARMLEIGPYPGYLKRRIASDTGHLSNRQTESVLETLASDKLVGVIGMHISQENNDRSLLEKAIRTTLEHMGISASVDVAGQNIPRSIRA